MGAIHKNLAAGRWLELSLCEQMGNIGSEVGRAAKWHQRGVMEARNKALDRAFELLDLTVADKRWYGQGKLKEICRAREVLADVYYGDNQYNDSPEKMEKYFYQYALAARKDK